MTFLQMQKQYPKYYLSYSIFGIAISGIIYFNRKNENEVIRLGIAGGLSTALNFFLIHPVVLVNLKSKAGIGSSNSNPLSIIKSTLKEKGLLGFARGYSCFFYSNLPTGFCYFASYKYIKNALIKDKDEKIHTFEYIVASLLAEIVNSFLNYPFELVLTRMIIDKKDHSYIGPLDGFKKIINGKIKNVPLLYKGLSYSFAFNASTMVTMLVVVESLREFFKKINKVSSVNDLDTKTYLFCSIIGGVAAALVTNPLDVVYIHKQVDENFHLKNFIREKTIKIFYQGIGASISLNVITSIFYFYAIDEIGKIFNVEL